LKKERLDTGSGSLKEDYKKQGNKFTQIHLRKLKNHKRGGEVRDGDVRGCEDE